MNALFDTSATHSFVSYECANRLGLKINDLPYDLNVSAPTSTHVLTSHICLNCVIYFGKNCTTIDLICLSLHDIDVIIRMDRLSIKHAFWIVL